MMPSRALEKYFTDGGNILDVGSDRPFILDGDQVWYVLAGRVDVFRVPLHAREPAGARSHLLRVGEGQLMLGVDRGRDRPLSLLAVGATGTKLVQLPESYLRQLAIAPDHRAQLAALLDSWIELLWRSVAAEEPPDGCIEVYPGQQVPADAHRIRGGGRITWVCHDEGNSLLLGRAGLEVNGAAFTPLSRQVWLDLSTNARLSIADTSAMLERNELWRGLDHLHDLVLDCATHAAEQAVRAERDRLRRKAAANRRAFGAAFSRLASTITSDGDVRIAAQTAQLAADNADADGDALFLACQRLGVALGIEMRPALRSQLRGAPHDPLTTIAHASRVRARQVLLREGWWHHDGGAFLAHLEPDKRPVALIPIGATGYVLFDPIDRTERRVDTALAEMIDPRAHSFYRPFDDESVNITKLLRFSLRGCGRDLGTVALVSIAAGLLSLIVPIATGIIFNDSIPGANRSQLAQLTLALLAIAIATALFEVTRSIALIRIQGKMETSTQSAVWDRLLSLPMPFFRPYAAGDLATRAMGIDAIRQLLGGYTIIAMIGGIVSLFHFGLLFHYSARLALWAALIIFVAVVVTVVASRLQTRHERAVTKIQTRLAGAVLQFLTSISKLRVAGAEVQAFSIWARSFSQQRRLQYRARTVGNVVASFNAALPAVAYLILYARALPMMLEDGTLRTGDFMAFTTSFATCLTGLLGACAAFMGSLSIIPLYEQARPILTTLPEVDRGKSDPGTLTGTIELQHLRFRYQHDGPPVLRDLTLRVRAGEFVALVGPSGSGKSTVLRLLLGFENPETGAIYYDGQDLAGLDRQAVRRQIGVVLQNGRLLAGDIFTNIVGSSLATLDAAWQAARMAGLEDDIKAMPMGMHTVIGEGATTLSGGQRQRLLIARALVNKPRVLLFDEATSALDNRTQDIVTTSLDQLKATRIVIAHRLSTIMRADAIYVIDRGRIIQNGTYDELMQAGGLFAELARRQLV